MSKQRAHSVGSAAAAAVTRVVNLALFLTVKTLTGMTTDVYPRENCLPLVGNFAFNRPLTHGPSERVDMPPEAGERGWRPTRKVWRDSFVVPIVAVVGP